MPSAPLRPEGLVAGLIVIAALAVAGCQEDAPTSVDLDLLAPEPITLEFELPWADFGSNLAVYGGYGAAVDVPEAIIARGYGGTLDARVLMRFNPYPTSASVLDSLGTVRSDTTITFFSGYVVAFFDPLASTNTGPVSLALGALENQWHGSATWAFSVDTLGDQRAWPEPGAGPVTPLTTRDWEPADGDSIQFFLDSAQVAAWDDPASSPPGARIELLTNDVRLRMVGGALRLLAHSTIDPDTVLLLSALAREATVVYEPGPAPPTDGMRVGGAPAWRTVLDVALPSQLTGPPELCAAVGCPFTLLPRHVSFAALSIRSRQPAIAFQPSDSVALDVRAVLSRSTLPKSPLGNSLIPDPAGLRIGPSLFGAQQGTPVEIPITNFVKGFLAGPDAAGRPPPTTLALMSASEPRSFTFAEFFGPGGPNEPVLKLVLTVSRPLEVQ